MTRPAGSPPLMSSSCRAAAVPPILSQGVNDRTMFHADNAYYYPAVQHPLAPLAHQHRFQHGLPRLWRAAGHGVCRTHDGSHRHRTGLDALDVRKRNLYGKGRDITPYGMKVEDNIAPEIMGQLEASSDYRRRRAEINAFNAANRMLKKGLALTPVKFGISFTLTHLNQAGALVHVYTDGSVHLNHGGTEMGQGLYQNCASGGRGIRHQH